MEKSLHRSRQKIPFNQRQHLHDGLRMMTPEIPKMHGWHLPRNETQHLDNITDDLEDRLYRGTLDLKIEQFFLISHCANFVSCSST